MNRWGIPAWLEQEVLARDTHCIYCGVQLHHQSGPGTDRKSRATWEHIINDASIRTRANIALCCTSCNASKGVKSLSAWLGSKYCEARGITEHTIAEIARRHLSEGI